MPSDRGTSLSDVSQLSVALRWNVGQRDLIDSQQVGQQLCVELVGLGAALYHGTKTTWRTKNNF